MKIRSLSLLAAVLIIPAASTVIEFNSAYAQRSSNRLEQSEIMAKRPKLSPEQREAKRAKREAKFKEALELSDEQAQNIKAIRESYKPQKQRLRQEARALKEKGATREERKPIWTQKKALRMEMYEEIKAELTPQQVQKLEEMKAQRGKHRRNWKGNKNTAQ